MANGSPIESVTLTNIHKNNGAITPCFQILPDDVGDEIRRNRCPSCSLYVLVSPDANTSCSGPILTTGLVYVTVPRQDDAAKQQAGLHAALQKAACGLDQDDRASDAFAAYLQSHPATS